MKISRVLALLLVLSMLAGVSAYAADEPEQSAQPAAETSEEPSPTDDALEEPEPTEEPGPTEESEPAEEPEPTEEPEPAEEPEQTAEDWIVMDRHAGRIVLEGCAIGREESVLLRTVFGVSNVLTGIRPGAAGESAGYEVLLKNMSGVGDILHEDFDCPLALTLEGAEITGSIVGATRGAWDAKTSLPMETEEDASAAEAEETNQTDETQTEDGEDGAAPEQALGIRMTMDGTSVWNVTGRSQLYSFSLDEGAEVRAPEGQSLAIYVDCVMDNAAETYDDATGSRIAAFVPGVTYEGVVIEITEEETDGSDPFAALGVDTAVVDGQYSVSIVEFLEAMGVDVRVDETTGAIIVDDPDGVLNVLTNGAQE